MLSRRCFLRWLSGVPLLPLWPISFAHGDPERPAPTAKEGMPPISEFYKGEELTYEIGLWVLKRVALGRLSFQETRTKGRFMLLLQTETLGVMGWVARYRVDTYRAIAEEIDGGRRLRSLSFEEHVKIGSRVRRRIHTFDHEKRTWTVDQLRRDGTLERKEWKIPEGMIYDDFITSAYNFRYGAFGNIERGRKYIIPTFPRRGASSYEVRVATREEEEKRKRSESSTEGKDYFVRLSIDRDITHSKDGLIEGWLTKDLYPLEGAVKDVILFGDIYGRLIKRTKV
jgi:hypothetical protein